MGVRGETIEREEGLFLYEEHDTPERRTRDDVESWITLVPFSMGGEWYAADAANVHEVLGVPSITRVPNVPDFILGVTNIRGNITSVIDLLRLFGLGSVSVTPTSRIVVVRAARRTTSLLVDSVSNVLSVPSDFLQPTLSTLAEPLAEYTRGEIGLSDGRLLAVLDLEKVMLSERMQFE